VVTISDTAPRSARFTVAGSTVLHALLARTGDVKAGTRRRRRYLGIFGLGSCHIGTMKTTQVTENQLAPRPCFSQR
jgi:hypothetical protein